MSQNLNAGTRACLYLQSNGMGKPVEFPIYNGRGKFKLIGFCSWTQAFRDVMWLTSKRQRVKCMQPRGSQSQQKVGCIMIGTVLGKCEKKRTSVGNWGRCFNLIWTIFRRRIESNQQRFLTDVVSSARSIYRLDCRMWKDTLQQRILMGGIKTSI